MRPIDAMNEKYDLITLFGQPMLTTCMRINRNIVPDGLHCYDLRHGDDGNACSVEAHVTVNHYGTVLCKEPIDFGETDRRKIKSSDINYLSYEMNVIQFMEASREKLAAMCGRQP